MHRLIEDHPALAAVREKEADLAERRTKLAAAVAREDERFRRKDREYKAAREAAIAAGEPVPEPPMPVMFTDEQWAIQNEAEALRQERRAVIAEVAPELHDLLNERERDLLAAVHDAARLIQAAARELAEVTQARAHVAAVERPGDRAAQEPVPCEPADVLIAALAGAERLPARTADAALFRRVAG